MSEQAKELLRVEGLKKYFSVKSKGLIKKEIGKLYAVDDVSFTLNEGETLGIVGESGCGKTTLGKTLIRLYEPTGGHVYMDGQDVFAMNKSQLHQQRRRMQIIFQDPYSSLNPRMTVKEIVAEPLKIYGEASGNELNRRVMEMLEMVGLSAWHANRYPSEFSGGQRQRVGIARALILRPRLVVCDEPVSALDVSVQSQVLNLLADLQKELNLSYLFIAHGMAVVKHISDRIGVMYLGKMVEIAPKSAIYDHPLHPYTQALMSAIPIPDPAVKRERITLGGEVPSPVNPKPGCRFAGRCPYATDLCRQQSPELHEAEPGHLVACHHLSI
ncbi:MAG: dipeptide ABC transporter ATP-binding protein [Clostridia bacterium]|nr:dipeptide ABC transporter ATP-binding protein [Clostridia bacterium]